MAHHKSALKRIRQDQKKKVHNKYFAKTTRNAIRDLRNESDKDAASKKYSEVVCLIDKLAKKNIIHNNKASNLKSKLALHISKL